MPRIRYFDFLKGFLIILVVIGHVIQSIQFRGDGFWEDSVFKSIYMFHMPLFMALSGYLAKAGIERDSLFSTISSRFKMYVLPIFAWSVLRQLMFFAFGKERALVSFPFEVLNDATSSLWFLWAIYFSTVIVAASKLFENFRDFACGVAIVLVFLLPDFKDLALFKFNFPFFLVGFYLAKIEWDIYSVAKRWLFVGWGLMGLISLYCFFGWSKETYVYNSGMQIFSGNSDLIVFRYVAGVAASAFAFGVIYAAYRCLPSSFGAVIEFVGVRSLQVYLVQGHFIKLMFSVSSGFGFLYIFEHEIFVALAGFVVVGLCLVLGRLATRNRLLSSVFYGK